MGRITFILGAGISKDFGYPLGGELKELVNTEIQSNSEVPLDKKEGIAKGIQQAPSLDEYLSRYSQYREEILPLMIWKILKCEEASRAQIDVEADNVFTRLFRIRENHGKEHVKFITFNYDRLLEHYFFQLELQKMKKDYPNREIDSQYYRETFHRVHNWKPHEPWENQSPHIIHVYGRLHPFPGERFIRPDNYVGYLGIPGDDLEYADSKIKFDSDFQKMCLECFRTAYEVRDLKRPYSLHDLVSDSAKVIFLGFGYHELNFRILDTKGNAEDAGHQSAFRKKGISYEGTVYRLDEGTVRGIREQFVPRLTVDHRTALEFLKTNFSQS